MTGKERVGKRLTQTEELAVLRKVAYITSEELDLDWVLQEVVAIVSEVTVADSVFIYLFDEKKEFLSLKASKTPHEKELRQVVLKMGEGVTGWTAEKNEIVVINKNAYKDKRFKNFDVLPEDHYEALLSIPVVYKGNPIGVMNVQNKDPKCYRKRLVDLIITIARTVAGLIENARLYEESKKKINRFESLVKIGQSITSEQYLDDILQNIVDATAKLLNSKICSLMLVDKKKNKLMIKATQSLSEDYKNKAPVDINNSISGDVIKSQKALAIYDVKQDPRYLFQEMAVKEHLTSLLLVPMIIKNQAIGILNVYTKNHTVFVQEEIETLQIIANQAAVTIDNRTLMEENIKTKEALESRKIVERAKGMIMKKHQIDEDTAYRLIHKRSMDSCRSMKEIAEAIILTEDIGF
jgi:signal transduction protein with GAF and PtsI domain